jgi:hypothetical protein
MSGDQRRPNQPLRGRVPLDTLESLESLRPSSLPPELGDLDFKWDDDLADPTRTRQPGQTTSKLELDLDLDEGDRPTAVPAIPMEQFVAQAMEEVERREQAGAELPPALPFDMRSSPPAASFGATEGDSSFPPTLPSNRVLIAPIQSAYSAIRKPIDPLSVDLAEMDFVQPDIYLTPTEPPDDLLGQDQRLTIAPTEAARARQNEAREASMKPAIARQAASRADMKDRYAMGDFTSALEIAETLLISDSADLEAQRYATSCRDVLTQMYLSRLGGLDQIINVVLPPEELRWLNLDHRAGFLLSLVDGASTIDELLDISGMPRLDALKILAALREQRAILLASR